MQLKGDNQAYLVSYGKIENDKQFMAILAILSLSLSPSSSPLSKKGWGMRWKWTRKNIKSPFVVVFVGRRMGLVPGKKWAETRKSFRIFATFLEKIFVFASEQIFVFVHASYQISIFPRETTNCQSCSVTLSVQTAEVLLYYSWIRWEQWNKKVVR